MDKELRHFSKDIKMANKHMKTYSVSLVIREMWIKTPITSHFILIKMSRIKKKTIISVTKEAEKLDPSYSDCRDIKWHNHFEKQQKVPQRVEHKPNNSTSMLGIYPWELKTLQTNTSMWIFIAALFIISKRWKQPKCLSMNR